MIAVVNLTYQSSPYASRVLSYEHKVFTRLTTAVLIQTYFLY